VLLSTVGRLPSPREYKLCLHRCFIHRYLPLEICKWEVFALMHLTIESVYYLIAIVSIACGAAYKLGYANGKNAKK